MTSMRERSVSSMNARLMLSSTYGASKAADRRIGPGCERAEVTPGAPAPHGNDARSGHPRGRLLGLPSGGPRGPLAGSGGTAGIGDGPIPAALRLLQGAEPVLRAGGVLRELDAAGGLCSARAGAGLVDLDGGRAERTRELP